MYLMNKDDNPAEKEPAKKVDRYIIDLDADEDFMDKVIVIEEEGEWSTILNQMKSGGNLKRSTP